MTSLIVQLPPRDPAVPSQEWRLPPLPFVLFDKRGRTMRVGRAPLATLPRASLTVLVFAARDVLLLAAPVPPLKGVRLRQALPNIVEDQLIQDAQTCHIALDPQTWPELGRATLGKRARSNEAAATAARRVVGVIDRGWFRFVYEAFRDAGHRTLRAVPVTRCLPAPIAAPIAATDPASADAVSAGAEAASAATIAPVQAPVAAQPVRPSRLGSGVGQNGRTAAGATARAEPSLASAAPAAPAVPVSVPVVAALLDMTLPTDPALPEELLASGGATHPRIEVALAHGPLGEGIAVPVAALASSLDALLPETGADLYRLVDLPDDTAAHAASVEMSHARAVREMQAAVGGLDRVAQSFSFEDLARRALACKFNLCQFEFTAQPWQVQRATARRVRPLLMLAAASIVIALIGLNVQWLMLSRQRDQINARMTELLLAAFPRTSAVLDPPAQMSRQLDQLRASAGELSPTDFLSLADGLSRSLGAIPVNSISQLDYDRNALQVAFKPGTTVDDGFGRRLVGNGLKGVFDGARWMIRSAQ